MHCWALPRRACERCRSRPRYGVFALPGTPLPSRGVLQRILRGSNGFAAILMRHLPRWPLAILRRYGTMKLDWFWIELGFHPDMPLPVMTMALIRAARDKRLAALKATGAGAADIVRLHFAFQEAKRFATDR